MKVLFSFLGTLFFSQFAGAQSESFLDKVLNYDDCRDCYFILVDVDSGPYTGKIVVESDDLQDFLAKTEGIDKTKYKDYAKDLVLSKRRIFIKDAYLEDGSLRSKDIGKYKFRLVVESEEVDRIASNGCVPLVRYYFLRESIDAVQNSEPADCKTFIRNQNKPLSLTRDGATVFEKQNAIIRKLFEWEIPIRLDHYSGWLVMDKTALRKSSDSNK